MKIKLNRAYLPEYTVGKMFIDGVYFCDTFEDVNRDLNKDGDLTDVGESKVYGKTCIPVGTYKVIVNMSNRFKRLLPLLINVPSFDGIRIHNGIDETSSSGCIIVGKNTIVGQLTDSRKYMNLLTDKITLAQKSGAVTIEIS
jgi:hypothetical protein